MKGSEPIITVILPVYNTGSYLKRCLESVRQQSFRDFHLLCINDGSSDDSPAILDEYASQDPRMRVIHLPENHGVPFARNLALDEARSEYVYFMDSDDWIDPGFLEAMHRHAVMTGQDVVINRNWIFEYDDASKNTHSGSFGFLRQEDGFYLPVQVQSRFFPVVWARLYKLEYLNHYNIKSPLLKGGVEDNYFTALAEILQNRSYIFSGPCYHYYQRAGSLVRQPDATINYFHNFRCFLETLHERGIRPEQAKRFYVLNSFELKNEKDFRLIRDYFSDVREDVIACPELYYPFDVFAMEAVLSCTNIAMFKRLFLPSLHHYFNIKCIRSHFPTTVEVLDGKW